MEQDFQYDHILVDEFLPDARGHRKQQLENVLVMESVDGSGSGDFRLVTVLGKVWWMCDECDVPEEVQHNRDDAIVSRTSFSSRLCHRGER